MKSTILKSAITISLACMVVATSVVRYEKIKALANYPTNVNTSQLSVDQNLTTYEVTDHNNVKVNVRKLAVSETPLGTTIPDQGTPLAETPLEQTPVAEKPLAETPLQQGPVAETPLTESPLQQAPAPSTEKPLQSVTETPLVDVKTPSVVYSFADGSQYISSSDFTVEKKNALLLNGATAVDENGKSITNITVKNDGGFNTTSAAGTAFTVTYAVLHPTNGQEFTATRQVFAIVGIAPASATAPNAHYVNYEYAFAFAADTNVITTAEFTPETKDALLLRGVSFSYTNYKIDPANGRAVLDATENYIYEQPITVPASDITVLSDGGFDITSPPRTAYMITYQVQRKNWNGTAMTSVKDYRWVYANTMPTKPANEATLIAAIDAATPGDIIELGNDITLTKPLVINKNITLTGGTPDQSSSLIKQARSLTSADNMRHIMITTPDAVTITFDNVILQGRATGYSAEFDTADWGGGIEKTTGDLNLVGAQIRNCYSKGNGGGVLVANGNATITKSALGYNLTDQNGGGVYVNGNLTVNDKSNVGWVQGANAKNAAKLSGGGIYTKGETQVIDSLVRNNSALVNGGGIYSDGKVKISGASSILSNSAVNGNGGGVYAVVDVELAGVQDPISKNGVLIQSNNAFKGNGGAIYVNTTITLSGYNMISTNTALQGGGLFVPNKQTGYELTIPTGTSINSNTANAVNTSGGGGVYVVGKVTVSGGEISSNKAVNGSGGGIAATEDVTVSNGSKINGNSAKGTGGGIFTPRTVTVDGSAISSNISQLSGGAIWPGMGATISNSTINSNTAPYGGGIYILFNPVPIKISDTTMIGNNATTGNGGAINSPGQITFSGVNYIGNNHADKGNGGGIYAGLDEDKKGTELTIPAGTNIYGNTAINGGGVYAVLPLVIDGYTKSTAEIIQNDGSGIYGNTATKDGGGVYAQDKVTIKGAVIEYNYAENGAGIYANSTIDVSDKSSINRNYATIPDNELQDNDGAAKPNPRKVYGGGIYAKSTATITESTIKSNYAVTGDGGGIYMASGSGSLTIDNTIIQGNNSTRGNGGGIYTSSGVKLEIKGATTDINNNAAKLSGGGVYAAYDSSPAADQVTIADATIRLNIASTTGGGGVYVDNNLKISGSTIFANKANGTDSSKSVGGGIYVTGQLVMEKCTVGTDKLADGYTSGANTAYSGGGVYAAKYNPTQPMEITGSTIAYNQATFQGGGVYALHLKMDSTTVKKNNINNSVIPQALTGSGGGGIYVNAATLTNSTIENNATAGNYKLDPNASGGGVYAYNTLTLDAVTVKGNTAVKGGGVFSQGNVTMKNGATITDNGYLSYQKYDSTGEYAIISSGTANGQGQVAIDGGGLYYYGVLSMDATSGITNNRATQNGGGVYASSDNTSTAGKFSSSVPTITGGVISGNWAAQDQIDYGTNKNYISYADSQVDNYKTQTGGAGVYVNNVYTDKAAIITGTAISTNRTHSSGGGVFGKGKLAIQSGTTLTGNHASIAGGGVHVDGDLDVKSGVTINGNNAVGMYNSDYSGIQVNGNLYASWGGGGVSVAPLYTFNYSSDADGGNYKEWYADISGGTANIADGVIISGNTAGHITSSSTTSYASGAGINAYTLNLSGGTITANVINIASSNSTNGVGGGAGVAVRNTLTMSGGKIGGSDTEANIIKSSVANGGAGIYLFRKATANITGGQITFNRIETGGSGGGGAGIYADGGATLNVTGTAVSPINITNNSINRTSSSGGGVYGSVSTIYENKVSVAYPSKITLTNVKIDNNKSTQNGGGIYSDGIISLVGTNSVSNNTGSTNGGGGIAYGISVSTPATADPTLIISKETTIANNSLSNGYGGGVLVGRGTALISGTITKNQATVGGGLCIINPAIVTLKDSQITSNGFDADGNVKTSTGGGIHNGGVLKFESTNTISDNKSSGAGGGIFYNDSLTESTIPGGTTITNNTVVNSSDSNYTSGGGVYFRNTKLIIDGANITNNTATNTVESSYSFGGGIYYEVQLPTDGLTIKSGEISGNTAFSGGGVYSTGNYSKYKTTFDDTYGGDVFSSGDGGNGGVFTMSGGKISGNTALGNGGGVQAVMPVTVTGGEITANKANNGNGGGIYAGGVITTYSGVNKFTNVYSPVTISNAKVDGNTATWVRSNNGNGGGIYTIGGKVSITNSQITNNTAAGVSTNEKTGKGGGIYKAKTPYVQAGNDLQGEDFSGINGITIDKASVFSGNKATFAKELVKDEPDYTNIYKLNIFIDDKKWSDNPATSNSFTYGFNNVDIAYNRLSVIFDANGKEFSDGKKIVAVNDRDYSGSLYDKDIPKAPGKDVISSWNTKPDGTGQAYTFGKGTAGPTTDVTVYAQWVKYLIHYNYYYEDTAYVSGSLKRFVDGIPTKEETEDENVYNYDQSSQKRMGDQWIKAEYPNDNGYNQMLDDATARSKSRASNYQTQFLGWFTDEARTVPFVQTEKYVLEKLNLYAKWKEKVTYTYYTMDNTVISNWDTVGVTTENKLVGDAFVMNQGVTSYSKTNALNQRNTENEYDLGYTFVGWYTDKEFKTPFVPPTTYSKTPVSVYAKWVKNSGYYYHTNDRTIYDREYYIADTDNLAETVYWTDENPTQTIVYNKIGDKFQQAPFDSATTYSTKRAISYNNATFVGWFTDKALTIPFVAPDKYESGEVHVYAKWKKNPSISAGNFTFGQQNLVAWNKLIGRGATNEEGFVMDAGIMTVSTADAEGKKLYLSVTKVLTNVEDEAYDNMGARSTMPNALVFKDSIQIPDDQVVTLSSTSLLIRSITDNPQEFTWGADIGILLRVRPGEAKAGEYNATICWTIAAV